MCSPKDSRNESAGLATRRPISAATDGRRSAGTPSDGGPGDAVVFAAVTDPPEELLGAES